MTIEEVIAHQRELTEDFREFLRTSERVMSVTELKKQYEKQIKECEQIAEWLEELKERRQTNFDYVSLMDERYYEGYGKGYAKAIEKIVEQLKAGGTDE